MKKKIKNFYVLITLYLIISKKYLVIGFTPPDRFHGVKFLITTQRQAYAKKTNGLEILKKIMFIELRLYVTRFL